MKIIIALLLLNAAILAVEAQTEVQKGLDAITREAIKGQLGFLASDWTEGRAVGTKGAYMAADYIASVFQVYGIEPFGDDRRIIPSRREMMAGAQPSISKTYFQNFSLLEYSAGEEQSFSVVTSTKSSSSAIDFGYLTDFYVSTGTVGQTVNAPLVFVGYAFADVDKQYNDLKKIDVNGKIAVVLEGFPGHNDTSSAAYKKFAPEGRYEQYRLERNKASKLEKMGALAVIQINPNENPASSWAQNRIYPAKGNYYEADKPLQSYYDSRMSMPGDTLTGNIPVFNITSRVANKIMEGTGVNLEAFEKIAAQKMEPASKPLPGKSVNFKTTVKSRIVKARNVVGYIEGEKKDEYIVVGGHYDHLGKWDGWIWNGADDNASGTVGVMTLAKACKATEKKPEKSIIFAAWTGEEKGLWGSKYFVEQAQKNNLNVVLNLNYDMIARNTEKDSLKNQASMVYTKANAGIEAITKKNLEMYHINLDLECRASERPGGGSDHAPFAQAGIPVFYFMAAMHPDYHQPSDELDKINWDKMTDIIRIGFLNTWEFANSDKFLAPQSGKDEVATPEP
jgi:hypothetical protein